MPDKPVYKFTPAPAKSADQRDDRRDNRRDDRRDDRRDGRSSPTYFDNRDQDPNHPANTTQPRDMRPGAERDRIEGPVYSSENLMTEQEKAAFENVQGSSAKQPYPVGDPPPPSESVSYGQGIKGVTDQPSAKPGSSAGPAGRAPAIDEKPPQGRQETNR